MWIVWQPNDPTDAAKRSGKRRRENVNKGIGAPRNGEASEMEGNCHAFASEPLREVAQGSREKARHSVVRSKCATNRAKAQAGCAEVLSPFYELRTTSGTPCVRLPSRG